MTISSTTRRWDYTGSDSTDTYAYTTRIRDESHIKVTETDTGGTESVLVLTNDYTVTGVGNSTGGNVVRVDGNLPTGYTWTIEIVEPLTQTTDIRNQGSFFPETHEDAFDHGIRVDQQQQDEIDRSTKLPTSITSSDFDPNWPTDLTDAADKVPLVNDTGDGWALSSSWPSGDAIEGAEAAADRAEAAAAAAAIEAGTLSPYGLNNLGLRATVDSNNLTIELKQSNGTSDPGSGTSSVTIYFRDDNIVTGPTNGRTVNAPLSIVVPNGATLGHTSGVDEYIYVYAVDEDGTIDLAVSSSHHWDEAELHTITAISTASDSSNVLYSSSGQILEPIRLIGRIKIQEATAGVWATEDTEIYVGNLFVQENIVQARSADFIPKHGITYEVDTTGGEVNVVMPAALSDGIEQRFTIKDSGRNSGNNNIILNDPTSGMIEGANSDYNLAVDGGCWDIYSGNGNWHIKAQYGDNNFTDKAGNFTARHGGRYALDTSASRTITMPSSPRRGDSFLVKDVTGDNGSNATTFSQAASESLDLIANDYTWGNPYGSIKWISDGTDWFVIGEYGGGDRFGHVATIVVADPGTISSSSTNLDITSITTTVGNYVSADTGADTISVSRAGMYQFSFNLGSLNPGTNQEVVFFIQDQSPVSTVGSDAVGLTGTSEYAVMFVLTARLSPGKTYKMVLDTDTSSISVSNPPPIASLKVHVTYLGPFVRSFIP